LSAPLTRPGPGPDAGPLDDRLYDLVESRFRRVIHDDPLYATSVGLHDGDDRWGDGTRDAILADLEADRAHRTAVASIDPDGLSAAARFERDLELHNLDLAMFETEVVRTWERRSTAFDRVGDGLFLLLARDFAPLAERLDGLVGRLASLPAHLAEHRTRATVPQVRLWQQLEIDAAADLPLLVDQVVEAARTSFTGARLERTERAAAAATEAIEAHAAWIESTLEDGVDDWALGSDRYDELVARRRFDGLDVAGVLEVGREQLATQKAARIAAARELDPSAPESVVVDRVKSDHPDTFGEALTLYRDVMVRARRHLVERGLVTIPDDERLEVVETPVYLRKVVPFAAYFDPPKFDARPTGIYIVTPSVAGEPDAMREHNRSAISNTSLHEAYPGHHLQLALAVRHPSLTRLMTDAPEFTEGWGMYSEQMMREEGFDDGPAFRVAMHTDAIWRACRIVLDIEMHRGEVAVDDAVRFLVEHTGFERANARAEVLRYTYTPGYQLSYLLGKVLLLSLRDEERRRWGDRFSLRTFHDRLLRAGSLPVSFQRQLLAGTSTPDGSAD
jgi:uncharacterized protein (DUF885 family)